VLTEFSRARAGSREAGRRHGGTLEAPADHEPDRVHVRDGPVARARDGGRGLANGGPDDGLQAARGAQGHWRRPDGAELIPLVRAGVRFFDGVRIEREDERKKAVA